MNRAWSPLAPSTTTSIEAADITYHGPGQLVVYPIFDLEQFFTDLHKFLRYLEEAVILTIAEYGLKGERLEGATGVWLDADIPEKARKICAIGIRMSRWVSMHGLALNVNTNLDYFKHIVPCGIDDKAVTSMEKELGRKLDFEEVSAVLPKAIADTFRLRGKLGLVLGNELEVGTQILLKLGHSALAIFLILRKVDLEEALANLSSANLGFILLAFSFFFISKVISAFRINALYHSRDMQVSQLLNGKLTFMAMFYNLFVPLVGGEAYKAYWLKKNYEYSAKVSLTAALLDRLAGMVALTSSGTDLLLLQRLHLGIQMVEFFGHSHSVPRLLSKVNDRSL